MADELPEHSAQDGVPVSSTGSLWDGFGGWLVRVCAGLLLEPVRRQPRATHTVCRVIQPGSDWQGRRSPSQVCLSQRVKCSSSCSRTQWS
ncbi:hypothetical protein GO755_36055 [Spirosoma sp. HMF4905]|uniref:Uncharacterized protein n=1 Tax=Spirosoma arboris TaxID=2682092 RepID=A0A7K1SNV3_9BACT|nr:hypothetical protein [Spirosoma arboris]MVM35492.1 hypothetical protein [Spirosoma arboris]